MSNKRVVHTRFNTISSVYGSMVLEQYKEPEQAVMPYVVDTSSFIPMSEAVKKVIGKALDPATVKSMYDFPDGKGTADHIPVDRTHRFSGDIAEMSVALREAQAKAKDSLDKSYQQFQAEQAQADIDAQIASYNQPGATSE